LLVWRGRPRPRASSGKTQFFLGVNVCAAVLGPIKANGSNLGLKWCANFPQARFCLTSR
jgi:hypothetical protein